MIRSIPITALLLIGLLAGCGETTTTVTDANPYPPVPAPLAETMPNPPVSPEKLLWQPGHWDWTGNGYAWKPGQYVPAAGHGPLFQPGYWAQTPTGWAWQAAHWTS